MMIEFIPVLHDSELCHKMIDIYRETYCICPCKDCVTNCVRRPIDRIHTQLEACPRFNEHGLDEPCELCFPKISQDFFKQEETITKFRIIEHTSTDENSKEKGEDV